LHSIGCTCGAAAQRAECDGTAAAALAASSLSQAAAAAAEEEEEEKVFGVTFRLVIMTMRSAIIFFSRNIVCIDQKENKINYFITISGPKFSSHGLQDFASTFASKMPRVYTACS
jgi:hypothetical protein